MHVEPKVLLNDEFALCAKEARELAPRLPPDTERDDFDP